MTITEQQLEIWARNVQLNQNTETYNRVKEIFQNSDFNDSNDFEIYLQGSVANNTNIWEDGDIDIVIQFNGIFSNNAPNNLTESDYQQFQQKYPDSNYTKIQFRSDIESVLKKQNIGYQNKNKCFKLSLGNDYQPVDLVPCSQYRNYKYFDKFDIGVIVATLNQERIVNYPKQHKKNGENKNANANNYKQTVRIFKNIKKKLIDENTINKNLASSYFIECLIYNIPNSNFDGNYRTILLKCLKWILDNYGNLEISKCQNEITYLFGNETTQWNLDSCKQFINKVIAYVIK